MQNGAYVLLFVKVKISKYLILSYVSTMLCWLLEFACWAWKVLEFDV